MQNPAKMKLIQIIRSAGTPISTICSDASKKPSSTSGKNSITAIPTSIIETAHMHPTFMVRIMRSFFCAP